MCGLCFVFAFLAKADSVELSEDLKGCLACCDPRVDSILNIQRSNEKKIETIDSKVNVIDEKSDTIDSEIDDIDADFIKNILSKHVHHILLIIFLQLN